MTLNRKIVSSLGFKAWMSILALFIYGLLSSPFPSSYGIPEISIGILLILAASSDLFLIKGILIGENHQRVIAFAWLITVPTLIGIEQWKLSDIVRDLVPLFFLFIPLFFVNWYKNIDRSKAIIKVIPYIYSIVGVVYALRYFVSNGIGIDDLAKKSFFAVNLMYYSYDPTVVFSAVFLSLTAIQFIHFLGLKVSTCLIAIVMVGLALIGIGSLAGSVLRAPLVLIALSLIIFVLRYTIQSRSTAFMAIVIAGIVFVLFREQFESIFSLFLLKTQDVGGNGKLEEFNAILSYLSDSPLLGLGWGATYYNPVLHTDVRFSHSIISFYFLKTGLVGILLLFIYLGWLVKLYYKSFRIAWKYQMDALPLLFAIGSTLLIGLLQVTYKTLSYGMVMALIPVLYHCLINPDVSRRSLEKNI